MARQIDNPEWNAGYEAYFDGEPRDESRSDEWIDGWDAADSDDDSE